MELGGVSYNARKYYKTQDISETVPINAQASMTDNLMASFS